MSLTRRQQVLGGLFVLTGLVTLVILSRVLGVVFFAITVAYVLYPVRRELVRRGVPSRVAAGVATTVGFAAAVLVVAPLVYALYIRRGELLAFIQNIPSELTIALFGMTYPVPMSSLVGQARSALVSLTVSLAGATPVLALKGFLFLILVYGLLLRPEQVRRATLRVVPGEYHDVTLALHRRVRDTLYALYVLQAATALGTFAVAYVVFLLLGFEAAFTLAVLSGLLQFIPVVGPSILVALVAAGQVLAGEVATAILVTVFGLVFVGFLPDALIRPRLASLTTGMPASLYFVGFTGGTLTLGVVGVIAGPLAVALFVEVVELITDERTSVQQTLDDATATRPPSDADASADGDSDTVEDDSGDPFERSDGPFGNAGADDGERE
jgi:predicted PurR-regulated permease PerM